MELFWQLWGWVGEPEYVSWVSLIRALREIFLIRRLGMHP